MPAKMETCCQQACASHRIRHSIRTVVPTAERKKRSWQKRIRIYITSILYDRRQHAGWQGEVMNDIKLCKDCKHCVPFQFSFFGFSPKWAVDRSILYCHHNESKKIELDTGDTKYQFCRVRRILNNSCGPSAKQWEGK